MNAQAAEFAATEALLAFWRDAGVDACYDDEPTDRTRIELPAPRSAAGSPPSGGNVTSLSAVRGVGAQMASADAIAEARRLAAAAQTLDELAKAVATFEGCDLRGMGATQSVFGRGNPNAPVLIVGEAPGLDEDRQGQPFLGQAGQLLDRILAAAELTDQVFITNTVYWRPPGNRNPTPQEQAVCAPFLERTFALIKPKAVLLIGGSSAKAVFATDEGITRIRGQWREWRITDGPTAAPAMATLHPAFLLRQPQAKRQVWADMLSLRRRLETDTVEP